jgi:hypothetical protein
MSSRYLDNRPLRGRVLRIKRLFVHLVATIVLALAITAGVDRFNVPRSVGDVVIPAAVLLFVARALWVSYQEATYFIVQQEAERERQRDESWSDEKPKRGRLELGDDGELVEIVDDAEAELHDTEPKRRETL